MRRARSTSVLLGAALAIIALVFAVAASQLSGARVVAATPAALDFVIPPGRETEVTALVRALGPTFAGHALGDIQIEKDEVRVQLVGPPESAAGATCTGPAWVRTPGALRLRHASAADAGEAHSGEVTSSDLRLTWFLCGDQATAVDASGALERARSTPDVKRIWSSVSPTPPADGASSAPPSVGLLSPVASALGCSAAWIAIATWLAGFALALGAPRLAGLSRASPATSPALPDGASPRTVSLVAAALAVAGVVVRISSATSRALDGDEPWAFPSQHPILSGDHDAWIHPPLFRALQAFWGAAVHFHPGDALVVLRMPSLVASSIAVALVTLAAWRSGALVALLPVVVVALSPVVSGDGVLARPYGLAACFVTVVVALLFGPPPRAASTDGPANQDAGLRLSLALVAFGAAAWTDLLAGLVAALALVLALSRRGAGVRARAVVGAVAAVWAAPIVPGALVAMTTQVTPAALQPGAPAPDLAPLHGLGHGSSLLAFDALASFTVLGAPIAVTVAGLLALGWLLALALAARRTAAFGATLLPLASLAIVVAVATRIGLRTRNVLFLPHLAALAFAVAAPALLALARRRR